MLLVTFNKLPSHAGISCKPKIQVCLDKYKGYLESDSLSPTNFTPNKTP